MFQKPRVGFGQADEGSSGSGSGKVAARWPPVAVAAGLSGHSSGRPSVAVSRVHQHDADDDPSVLPPPPSPPAALAASPPRTPLVVPSRSPSRSPDRSPPRGGAAASSRMRMETIAHDFVPPPPPPPPSVSPSAAATSRPAQSSPPPPPPPSSAGRIQRGYSKADAAADHHVERVEPLSQQETAIQVAHVASTVTPAVRETATRKYRTMAPPPPPPAATAAGEPSPAHSRAHSGPGETMPAAAVAAPPIARGPPPLTSSPNRALPPPPPPPVPVSHSVTVAPPSPSPSPPVPSVRVGPPPPPPSVVRAPDSSFVDAVPPPLFGGLHSPPPARPLPPPARALPPPPRTIQQQADTSAADASPSPLTSPSPPLLQQADDAAPQPLRVPPPGARPPPRVAPTPAAQSKPAPGRLQLPLDGHVSNSATAQQSVSPPPARTGGVVSARVAAAAGGLHLNPLLMMPASPYAAGGPLQVRSVGNGPVQLSSPREQQQPSSSQTFRLETPLDPSSVLVRVALPAGGGARDIGVGGHITINASSVQSVAWLRKKLSAKLARVGRLDPSGGSGLTEERVGGGSLVVAGSGGRVRLEDSMSMVAALAVLQPFLLPVPAHAASSMPRTALIELHCDGLAAPLVTADELARFVNPHPVSAVSAASGGGGDDGGGSKALEHATSSRPKFARPGRSAHGAKRAGVPGAGPAGLSKFTMRPNKQDDSTADN